MKHCARGGYFETEATEQNCYFSLKLDEMLAKKKKEKLRTVTTVRFSTH